MIVDDVDPAALQRRLRSEGIWLKTGPVVTHISSRLETVASGLALHYARHSVEGPDSFADFHVTVDRPVGVRRWIRPQVVFQFDGQEPFAPLPGPQGFPLLEWGLNWCVYTYCHQFITLHSAVLERGGHALLLPAPSGSGKSTLCAALAFHGWRLLSDELTPLDPQSGQIVPIPRPISLKNQSIEVIRQLVPDAAFSNPVPDTVKGVVAHVRPPVAAVERAHEQALPRWVVLPKFVAGAPAQLTAVSRAQTMMGLVQNTFNYSVHGVGGFAALAALVDRCDCYEFVYGDLVEAIAVFEQLAGAATRLR